MAMASSHHHHHHHHHHVLLLLLFALLLSRVEFSTCHLLKGSISCLDCHNRHLDLSGIKVVVKCSQVKKLAVATTGKDGTFEMELPSDTSTPSSTSSSVNCLAKIMGGPRQLYTSRKDTVARTVKVPDESESYTISKPLKFYASLPPSSQNDNGNFGSSKTVDLPLPPEWGLAPSSYYFPFFPIIGIP
ncbi:uncharacterized protein LOC127796542 [Diospyros lotus]|uniref:uncharacterized protein LOC127796542 n=1 Tax=Diospyros lotus TaxID=55363 RepID=UPI0022563D71|nr:uncharacterized protein LOC127796542 [Diospyros lotus]